MRYPPTQPDYERLYHLLLQRRRLERMSLDQFSRLIGDVYLELVEQDLQDSAKTPSGTRRTLSDLLVYLTRALDVACETDRLLHLTPEPEPAATVNTRRTEQKRAPLSSLP